MAEELTIEQGQELDRQELMKQAKSMGLKPHPATGVKKLKLMIEQAESQMKKAEGAESFDQDSFRKESEAKARIEAEAKVKVEFEMKPPKEDVKRKLSPEEIIVNTHPEVDIIFISDDGQDSPLHCTYGGKRWLLFPSKSYKLPYGFVDFLQTRRYPVTTQVPNPEAPGTTMPKRTGWRLRFHLDIVDNRAYADAKDKAKELGYIPRKEHAK